MVCTTELGWEEARARGQTYVFVGDAYEEVKLEARKPGGGGLVVWLPGVAGAQ